MKKIFKHFWPEIRRHWKSLGVAATAMVVASIADAVFPFLLKDFANILSENPSENSMDSLQNILIQLCILYVFFWITWRIIEFSIVKFESKSMRDLEKRCFNTIQQHSFEFFQENFSGSLVKKVGRFVRSFEAIFDWILFTFLLQGLGIVITFIVFAVYEPLFALFFILWVFLFIGGNVWFSLWKLKYDKATASADSFIGACISDSISNNSAVRTFAKEKEEYQRISDASEDLFQKRSFAWKLNMIGFAVQAFLMFTLEFLLFFLMAKKWEKGEFSVGEFIFFQTYLFTLFHRLWDFGRSLRNLFTAVADASEMAEIFELKKGVPDIPHAKPLQIKKGSIEFKNTTFSYSENQIQLDDFSLKIPAGQSIAFVGHTGAGKTTITKLLFRFFDIQSGTILIDGQDISEVTQNSLRKSISLVPQQPELFHRTIAENIRFGNLNASMEEVKEAAKKAYALEFIESLTDGFETLVGERGVKLSGGEKQRVAIARAFLEDAPILILDEATSALDSITEKKIQSAISKLIENRTSIVIAHRLSTILQMDRIIVLENGGIIEDGTHEELLKKKGVYANMWDHQAGGFLTE